MNEHDIDQIINRIRKVSNHAEILGGSYPRILKGVPIYTRSHLIVFYEILPDLIRLLAFSSETIPVVSKILGLATEGKSNLEKASEYLGTINKSSETAVTEIFAALDEVGATLRKAQKSESVDDEQKQTLREANMQLMGIMNALQFQDITSQKIEATTALLANLGDGLIGLIRNLGIKVANHNITAREGTYDSEAAFDRDTAGKKQGEIDNLIADEGAKSVKKTSISGMENTGAVSANQLEVSEQASDKDAVAGIDDIDGLVASAQGVGASHSDNTDDFITSA